MLNHSAHKKTKAEQSLGALLDRNFPGQWKFVGLGDVMIGGKNPDFINVNGRKAVIELFGDYWHGEKMTGKPRVVVEEERIDHFRNYGLSCVVVWERELKDETTLLARLKGLALT